MKTVSGFSLVELMVAMAVSMSLIAGTGFAYIGISDSISLSKNIENTQEVLRYTAEVFSRSLKQTLVSPVSTAPDNIRVIQDKVGSVACDGTVPVAAPYTESYRFEVPNLLCNAGNGEVVILQGIANMSFAINGDLVQITVLPNDFPIADLPNGVRIDIAVSSKILMEETN
ncbi:PilW family protein [Pseudoalteromonas spongiae]|uniref:PilW family protein n=1 Tax=Pseudoalteromonas spongiae TaxID=298657 RepID=UPI00110B39C3|nr:prepilin-type N-terminal cleavage/methylation domain-containing protein [Pseudoalteromonas spongiae]TMO87486.1 prepilin-type cleavage/methylation domain-containing protein [Pseudoalteromonas spongiae]